ncbi:MAG TPA: YggS family pyridoxal phosphate-dependent enzyme [Bacillota bacterium]|nr:YggS family pyridoxal phosphate-dependent enzyme [Bacillota bacterium]
MSILENLNRVRERVKAAALRAGRNPSGIKVVAVTKNVTAPAIMEALACGVTDFGENRAQEFLRKYEEMAVPGLNWHFVGYLQTNKVRKIIGKVEMVHSLDRWPLAEALSRAACEAECVCRALVQVNVAGERTKHGLSVSETEEFIAEAARLPGLEIRGLMTIAPLDDDPESARPVFRRLKELFDSFREKALGLRMEFLSMGMSGDFEIAVEEGANILRIGKAIFGG